MQRLFSILMLIACCCNGLVAKEKTNVVLIMTDDQGAWTLGCYGNPEAKTPSIDRLAADGVRLTNAFATIPVCSPSRATFVTGRIPSQHGIHDYIKHENFGPRAMYPLKDEVLLSEVLAKNGYTCGISGKWHLGDSINKHGGYSYWYVLPEGASKYNDAFMVRENKLIKTKGYLTDRITDGALEFIEANKDRPFFANVQYNAPHTPLTGHPKELQDLYTKCTFDIIPKVDKHPWFAALTKLYDNRDALEQYMAAVTGVDRGVARILARLDELELSENTLVIFTSDQGFAFGHHGIVGKGNCTNPRNAYDTVLRIPLIFRHKGKLPKGKTVEAMIGVYDFYPTVLDYLGLKVPEGRNLPGRSFVPMLRGKKIENWPDEVFAEYGHLRMIRTRTHKYIHRSLGGPFELYDLEKDPNETTNLVDKAEFQKLRKQLRSRIFKWFDRYVEIGSDPVGTEYIWPWDR